MKSIVEAAFNPILTLHISNQILRIEKETKANTWISLSLFTLTFISSVLPVQSHTLLISSWSNLRSKWH